MILICGAITRFLWLIRWIHWFWQNLARLSTTKECGHFRAPSGTYRRGVCAPSRANYQISIWAIRLRLYQVVSAHLQKNSKNSKKILFPTTSALCVMPSICAHRVCTQWDGRANAAWDNPKGLRSIARPLCTTLMDNIGSTTQMWGWGAMGNTHPRAWIYRL